VDTQSKMDIVEDQFKVLELLFVINELGLKDTFIAHLKKKKKEWKAWDKNAIHIRVITALIRQIG